MVLNRYTTSLMVDTLMVDGTSGGAKQKIAAKMNNKIIHYGVLPAAPFHLAKDTAEFRQLPIEHSLRNIKAL